MKKVIFQNKFFRIIKEDHYEYIDYNRKYSGVVILLIINEEILFVNSFRFPIKKKQWELPRGFLNNKESPIKGALRELKEETGYQIKSKQAKILGYIAPDSGSINNTVPVVLIRHDQKQNFVNEDKEVIKGEFIHFNNLNNWLLKQKVIDSFTLSALQLLKIHGFL